MLDDAVQEGAKGAHAPHQTPVVDVVVEFHVLGARLHLAHVGVHDVRDHGLLLLNLEHAAAREFGLSAAQVRPG